jgi:glutamate-1-semialdehyde 2,1-aminomutase
VVEDGSVYQVGTYNGNPLVMAAARANLLEVLTPRPTRTWTAQRPHPRGLLGVVERYGLPGYAIGISSKGCVTFAP